MRPSTSSFRHRFRWKLPLRVVLVVPFVLPVVTVVGLMGYLSFRNGQQTVKNLANQSAVSVNERIEQTLTSHLRSPLDMTRSNAAAIRLNALDWRNTAALGQYFKQQLTIFDTVDAIAIADERKHFLAVERQPDGSIAVRGRDEAALQTTNRQVALSSGAPSSGVSNSGSQIKPLSDRAVRADTALFDDFWYRAARTVKNPTWRLVTSLTAEGPVLTAVHFQPFYDRADTLQSVLATSVQLSQLSDCLKALKIGHTGQAFIVERNGLLVATTNGEPLFRRQRVTSTVSEQPIALSRNRILEPRRLSAVRLSAVNSHDLLTQQAAALVVEQLGGFDRIQARHQLSFELDHQRYFVHVEPLGNDQNLDWLAVVVVPEADVMAVVDDNNRLTFLLCGGALMGAVVLGWLIASRIARPILRLSLASRELALGKWQHSVESQSKIAELEVLAHSFNQMTEHLQQSFDQVKTALQESEERFTKVFRTSPDAISIATLPERRYIEVNDRFVTISGYTREEIIGQSALSLGLSVNPEQADQLSQFVQTQKRVCDAEIDFRNKQGQVGTVLVSAEVIELDGETCLLCIYRDITARRQAEEALRESEQRFRNAFNTTAVGMCLTSPDGRFARVNASLCQMLGYTEAELLTLTFSEITHPDDVEATLEHAHKLLAGEISYYHMEKRYQHHDGRTIWCLLSVSLVRDSQQQPLYFVAQMQDITKQQAALDERQRVEASLQAVNTALSQRDAELSTLNHISQTVAAATDLSTALKAIAALVTDCFHAYETGISLLDDHRTALRTIASHHLNPDAPSLLSVVFPLGADDVAIRLFQHRKSIVITATDSTPGTEFPRQIMQARQLQCMMLIGLQSQGEVIGIISIAAQQDGRVFTPDEVKLAETIAGQVASAVQNARFFEAMQQAKKATEAANSPESTRLASLSHEFQMPQDHLVSLNGRSTYLQRLINNLLSRTKTEATRKRD